LHDDTLEDFSRYEAAERLPKSNPLLKKIFTEIGAVDFDDRVAWIIDDLLELFRATDVKTILTSYKKSDPIIHFYEDFLADYDPALRKARGVWYTPAEVVSFIVRGVDHVLEHDFGLTGGLTNTDTITRKIEAQGENKRRKDAKNIVEKEFQKVQILDPATGTGTFLVEVINQIYEKVGKTMPGNWANYVQHNLAGRINGFEIMMASYAMAHLRIDLLFQEMGIELNDRLNIFLTNSLEPGNAEIQTLFSDALTAESEAANKVKQDTPVMCVIGNPPYSAISKNKDEYIMNLIEDYKYVDGVHFNERKHWLGDDYVKFVRLSESFIEKNNEGVLGFITNNGYLDNPTFRGMRWHLLKTFDKIYIVDLHGNTKKKETSPDGSVDQNVFDIMAGVSIIIGVKNNTKKSGELGNIYHTDVYGKREVKNDWLNEKNLDSIDWEILENKEPYYFFVPKDFGSEELYNKGISVEEIFNTSVTGIVTARDSLVIGYSSKDLLGKLDNFLNPKFSDDEIRDIYFPTRKAGKYLKGDTRGWKLSDIRKQVIGTSHQESLTDISYRPFDKRTIYYSPKMVDWGRENVMQHFLHGDNLGLLAKKGFPLDSFSSPLGFISNNISESRSWTSSGMQGIESSFPLYLFNETPDGYEKLPNLNPDILKQISGELGLVFDDARAENSRSEFSAENLLDYIYAVLHTPSYRETFKEFLKIDFPKIPFNVSPDIFWQMVEQGTELRKLHLLESTEVSKNHPIFHGSGNNIVDKKIKFDDKKVWINESQYFDGVSDVAWNFYIGGYQPAQKYLKDRRGRELGFDEIQNYQKMIIALSHTDSIMKKLDDIISFKDEK